MVGCSLARAGSSGLRQETSSLPHPSWGTLPPPSQLAGLPAVSSLPACGPPSLPLLLGVTHFPKTNGSFFLPIHHCSWAHPLAAAPPSCPQPHRPCSGTESIDQRPICRLSHPGSPDSQRQSCCCPGQPKAKGEMKLPRPRMGPRPGPPHPPDGEGWAGGVSQSSPAGGHFPGVLQGAGEGSCAHHCSTNTHLQDGAESKLHRTGLQRLLPPPHPDPPSLTVQGWGNPIKILRVLLSRIQLSPGFSISLSWPGQTERGTSQMELGTSQLSPASLTCSPLVR